MSYLALYITVHISLIVPTYLLAKKDMTTNFDGTPMEKASWKHSHFIITLFFSVAFSWFTMMVVLMFMFLDYAERTWNKPSKI